MSTPRDEAHDCSASTADWVLFVGSLWTIWTSWWIPELVGLAAHRRGGMSFRQCLSVAKAAVQWNCARVLAPTYVAVMTMSRARRVEEWPALYYFGYEPDYGAGAIPGLTAWQWAKIVLMDFPPLLLQPALFAYSSSLYRRDITVPLLAARWVISATPAAFTGLYLVVTSSNPRLHPKGATFWLLMGLLSLVGVAFILCLYFFTYEGETLGWASGTSFAFTWALLMFPCQLWHCCGYLGPMLVYVISAAMRMVPILMDMLTASKDFPFCGANHIATVAVYLFFAFFVMFHSSWAGGKWVEKLCRSAYNQVKKDTGQERGANADTEDEEAVSLQSQKGLVQRDHDRVP
ncbi:hypothetical protein VUR80DRAFT_9057 [Thermomyces stellatus]